MNNWISVDELPKKPKNVLTISSNNIQSVAFYTKGYEVEFEDEDADYDEIEEKDGCNYLKQGWYECEETPGCMYDFLYVKRDVTHWQPLPQPPEIAHSQAEKDSWDSVN